MRPTISPRKVRGAFWKAASPSRNTRRRDRGKSPAGVCGEESETTQEKSMSTTISLEPFKPSKPTEHWCAECDCKIVNSEDGKSGSFFTVFGHVFSKESRQYDGEYVGVMFAVCSDCINERTRKHTSQVECTTKNPKP